MHLEQRVKDALNFCMNDLPKNRCRYFDAVGVVHSVVKTTRSSFVLRLTRLERIPMQMHARPNGFFECKPEIISYYIVDPNFDVAQDQILDVIVYDEHVDIIKNNLKSGDFVCITNLHLFVGQGADFVCVHGKNKNAQNSNERGIYLIPDDFEDEDGLFVPFKRSLQKQLEPLRLVPPPVLAVRNAPNTSISNASDNLKETPTETVDCQTQTVRSEM